MNPTKLLETIEEVLSSSGLSLAHDNDSSYVGNGSHFSKKAQSQVKISPPLCHKKHAGNKSQKLYTRQDLINDTYIEVFNWIQENEEGEDEIKRKIRATLTKYSFKMYRNRVNPVTIAHDLTGEDNVEPKKSNQQLTDILINQSKTRLQQLINLEDLRNNDLHS